MNGDSIQQYYNEHEAANKASDPLEIVALCHVVHSFVRLHGHFDKSAECFPPEDDVSAFALTSLPTIDIVYYRNHHHYELLVPTDCESDQLVSVRMLPAVLSSFDWVADVPRVEQIHLDEDKICSAEWREMGLKLFPQISYPSEFGTLLLSDETARAF